MASSWDDEDYYDLSFGVGKCRRYHERMRSFYEGWHDRVSISNAILSGSAFLTLIGGKGTGLATVLTAIVAVSATFDAKLQPSKKAKKHADLAQRFTELASKIES